MMWCDDDLIVGAVGDGDSVAAPVSRRELVAHMWMRRKAVRKRKSRTVITAELW